MQIQVEELADQAWEWLQLHGLRIVVALVTAVVAYLLWKKAIAILVRRVQKLDGEEDSSLSRRAATIGRVLHSAGVVVIVGAAFLFILPEVGIDIVPIIAGVGVVGLAVGLGAQTLVKDVISGLFLLIENQYTVGETLEVNGVVGQVEEMTLRVTMLRDINGAIHTIPNGEIRQVANRSRDWSRAMVDVSITYGEDVDRAVQALELIAAELQADETQGPLLLEAPVVTGVEGLDDWAVRLRLMVKTRPGEHLGVQRWLRRRIRLYFVEQKIDLAFPRQDVMIVSAPEK
jgi:small conductance mechanosensitive channel